MGSFFVRSRVRWQIAFLVLLWVLSLPSGTQGLWRDDLPYPHILVEVTKTIDHLYYEPDRIDYPVMFSEAIKQVQRALPANTLEITRAPQQLVLHFLQTDRHTGFSLPANREDFLAELYAVYALFAKQQVFSFPLKQLEYLLIEGMMKTLDAHSSFLSPQEFQEMQEDNQGSFGGIGIRVRKQNGYLTILETMENTPASQAGLQPGDRILKIDGVTTEGLTVPQVVSRIRGPRGTPVTLTIERDGLATPQNFTIIRGLIMFHSVSSRMLEDGIGYIRLRNFHQHTTEELEAALAQLQEAGLQGLILDLRDNPGGLLHQSVSVAEQFLQEGALVVYTQGRGKKQNLRFFTKRPGRYLSLPLIILMNSSSASASEIVAGALLDLQRAVAVGTKTFGKGSVQTILPLQDGSGLRLTTARYFTPTGKTVDRLGISPDYEVQNSGGEDRQLLLATKILQDTLTLQAKRVSFIATLPDPNRLLRQVLHLAKESPFPLNGHHTNGISYPDLHYTYQIIDTNGNGILNAGEQDFLLLTVQNRGNIPAKQVRVFLLSDSPLFPLQKPLLGDIDQGESKSIQLPLSIPLDVQDSRLTIIVKISEEGGYTSSPDLLEFLVKSR